MAKSGKYPKLSEREEEIMGMLWDRGPLFVREMVQNYPDPKPHINTISTFVRIMEEKGYVGHEAVGNSHRYFAVAKASDFAGRSLSQVIKNFFRNSPAAAVSALVEEEKITVDELKQIIDMIENKHNSEKQK